MDNEIKFSAASGTLRAVVGTHRFRGKILGMTQWKDMLIVATEFGVYYSHNGIRFYKCVLTDSSNVGLTDTPAENKS